MSCQNRDKTKNSQIVSKQENTASGNSSSSEERGANLKAVVSNFQQPIASQLHQSNECHIATGSHGTLSSHFEDNNWDYNFATRGLYLSQPWVQGRYTHTLGSESIEASTVLTLDPVVGEVGSVGEGALGATKLVEMYSNNGEDCSESDGYYA